MASFKTGENRTLTFRSEWNWGACLRYS